MALRRELKANKRAIEESGNGFAWCSIDVYCILSTYIERFFLVYWEEEEMVSVHPKRELLDGVGTVGEWCTVFFQKKPFKGKVAAIGMYTFVVSYRIIW